MRQRVYTLTLRVAAPLTSTENEVAWSINAALDEPPCDWGDWEVGIAAITDVEIEDREEEASDSQPPATG